VPPGLIGLFLLLALAASVALYHGVERPAQRIVNRWFDRRFPPRQAVSSGASAFS
jgi:peptidoglycan/LPS O-acetylase OafA/YrhL